MLLLLAISLFAKVQLLLPEFFCEGTMKKTDSGGRGVNVKEKE